MVERTRETAKIEQPSIPRAIVAAGLNLREFLEQLLETLQRRENPLFKSSIVRDPTVQKILHALRRAEIEIINAVNATEPCKTAHEQYRQIDERAEAERRKFIKRLLGATVRQQTDHFSVDADLEKMFLSLGFTITELSGDDNRMHTTWDKQDPRTRGPAPVISLNFPTLGRIIFERCGDEAYRFIRIVEE